MLGSMSAHYVRLSASIFSVNLFWWLFHKEKLKKCTYGNHGDDNGFWLSSRVRPWSLLMVGLFTSRLSDRMWSRHAWLREDDVTVLCSRVGLYHGLYQSCHMTGSCDSALTLSDWCLELYWDTGWRVESLDPMCDVCWWHSLCTYRPQWSSSRLKNSMDASHEEINVLFLSSVLHSVFLTSLHSLKQKKKWSN